MLTELLEVKMHPHPSHGKCIKELGAVELSWIQTLYCLLHIVHFPLVKQSELDLLIDTVEDRFVRIRKDFTGIRTQILFNPRKDKLHKSSKIMNSLTIFRIMTMLSLNWTVHSTLMMMSELHVCHLQTHTYWIPQKSNASQADGEFCNLEVCSNTKT